MKETRLLLNLYPVNSLRLGRIETRLKVEGKTRTWWINAAVREKLDRDHPETNKPEGEYVPEPIKLDTPEAHARFKRVMEMCDKLLAEYVPLAPLGSPVVDVADEEGMSRKFNSLSQEEQAHLEDTAEKLVAMTPPTKQDFEPWPEQWQRDAEARILRESLEGKLATLRGAESSAGEADFWG